MHISAKHRAVLIALIALPGLVIASEASPYSVSLSQGTAGGLVRWFSNTVSYKIDPSCSADLNTSVCTQAVRESFAIWISGQNCSAMTFVEDTSAWTNSSQQFTAFGSQNGTNELAWIEDSRWIYGSVVLGVTAPFFNPQNGSISEADIVFNGRHHTWQTSGAQFSTDVKNVAVHEIGHFFGLQHVLGGYDPNDPPTMAPTADPFMASRTPKQDDYDGLCFLYPAGSFSCSSDADCPLVVYDNPQGREEYLGQVTCGGDGLCGGLSTTIPEGTAQLGESCSGDFDCVGDGTCYGGVCTEECTVSPDSCPSGFGCQPYTNAPNLGLCFSTGGGGTKGLGEQCASWDECESQLCVQSTGPPTCHRPCLQNDHCPGSETCEPLPGQSIGACVAGGGQQPGGNLANGAPCESGEQCQSQLCAGSGFSFTCTQPCSSTAQCPSGYDCLPLSGGSGGCFQNEQKGTGEDCEGGSQCQSGLCFEGEGASGWCAGTCATNDDCPCGMQCVATSYFDGNTEVTQDLCNPAQAIGCLPDGQACNTSTECAGGACNNGVCERACSFVLGGAECFAGEGCARTSTEAVTGICSALGPNANGAPCGQDNACQSLFCHANTCQTQCNPFGRATCPSGLVCEATTVEGIGFCTDMPSTPVGPDVVGGNDDARGSDVAANNDTGSGDNDGCSAMSAGSGTTASLVALLLLLLRAPRRRQPALRA